MKTARAIAILLRALAHALRGWLTIRLMFGRLSDAQRGLRVQIWARQMLAILGIELQLSGQPPAHGPVLLVANHISWLDILVMHAARHCRFVSKSEVRHWPLIGTLATGAGTLYIERASRRDAMRVVHHMAERLAEGDILAAFPEGTTSDGRDVLKFHASLLEPVVAAGGEVWVVAVRYFRPAPSREVHAEMRTDAAAYIGDTTMLQSLHAIFAAQPLIAEVRFLEAIDCAGRTRREVAQRAQEAIRAVVRAP